MGANTIPITAPQRAWLSPSLFLSLYIAARSIRRDPSVTGAERAAIGWRLETHTLYTQAQARQTHRI